MSARRRLSYSEADHPLHARPVAIGRKYRVKIKDVCGNLIWLDDYPVVYNAGSFEIECRIPLDVGYSNHYLVLLLFAILAVICFNIFI